MTNWLIFASIIALAVVFAVVVAVITLRFLTVMQQMKRADSMDRSELMRELDTSHVAAFSNAMTALGEVQNRIAETNMAMFNRTMDMVHGPVAEPEKNGQPYATDSPTMDMRAAWQPDDEDDDMRFADPTDEDAWLKLGSDVQQGMEPRAVSVRPGETLVPGS